MNFPSPMIGAMGFMPHGHCYLWTPSLVWLHALSDGLTALAYFSIPAGLIYFVRKRHDAPYRHLFLMFGAFIVACGLTHAIEVTNIWQSHYWLSGWAKAGTAAISIATVLGLYRAIPDALKLVGPDELRKLNASLEERVSERTAELEAVNAALRREIAHRESLAAIVNSSRDAIIGTNLDGIVTEWNHGAESILGHAAATMIGQPFNHLLDAEQRPEVAGHFSRILRGEKTPEFETVLQRQDTTGVAVSVVISPILDSDGCVVGLSTLARDISQRKAAERERREIQSRIQESQKLESLGVLAGGIAHDFNNLLASILGNASLVRRKVEPASTDRLRVDTIITASRRAADLCQQMLAYSGRSRFITTRVDLNATVDETVGLTQSSLGEACALQRHLSAAPACVSANRGQMAQIVMNLLINASEAIGDQPGTITISTSVRRVDARLRRSLTLADDLANGAYICLEVSDTGAGMDEATAKRAFDPFFSTKFTGRGLGLAVVQGIVRGHHGALHLKTRPGRGTTFKIFLPQDTSDPVAVPPPPVSRPPVPLPGTVLVVDDEPAIREFATHTLTAMGLKVVQAKDGLEAVETFRAQPDRFQLVLLDLTMPRLNGQQAFGELRQIDPRVRVLLMSGFSEEDALARFTTGKLAGFLQKPFDPDELENAVGSIFGAN